MDIKFIAVCFAVVAVCSSCSLATHGVMIDKDGEYIRLESAVGAKTEGADRFVLVHGSSHGAWCWYKVVCMLQEKGYHVAAIDLPSLGRDKTSPDSVATMAQFAKPVEDYIAKVSGKVILVGHSAAGFVISHLMELMPEKIEKAVFLAANMPAIGVTNRTSPFPDPGAEDVVDLTFGNGPSAPPTSMLIKLELAADIYYNESPKEDITLAFSMLSPQPLLPFTGLFNFTALRYGRVRRFYIQTLKDHAAPGQDQTLRKNPPERVYQIDSDHSAFFSKPSELTSILESIYHIPAKLNV